MGYWDDALPYFYSSNQQKLRNLLNPSPGSIDWFVVWDKIDNYNIFVCLLEDDMLADTWRIGTVLYGTFGPNWWAQKGGDTFKGKRSFFIKSDQEQFSAYPTWLYSCRKCCSMTILSRRKKYWIHFPLIFKWANGWTQRRVVPCRVLVLLPHQINFWFERRKSLPCRYEKFHVWDGSLCYPVSITRCALTDPPWWGAIMRKMLTKKSNDRKPRGIPNTLPNRAVGS